jgi:hypothetical protein
MPVVRIELNGWYPVNQERRRFEFLEYLGQVKDICVVENENIASLCIVVNGRVLGLVDPYDGWETGSPGDEGAIVQRIRELNPALIFKYQLRRGIHYPTGTISAGYPCARQVLCPTNLLTRPRRIDIMARMRVNNDYHWGADEEWMLDRSHIVEEAKVLAREGYDCKTELVPQEQYVTELWDAQVGFDWRGVGYLTRRIIEYIRAGVVPIMQPFGQEWPVREDVVLEDGIHGVFCSDPREFAVEARLLLADRVKIKKIRNNLVELWREKLSPVAQGYWIWEKLKAALVSQPPLPG